MQCSGWCAPGRRPCGAKCSSASSSATSDRSIPRTSQNALPADLYGAALSHWNFARKREPGYARVRVFNPTIEEHGWQSTHTLIEIVNDDMPFLVDSVTMEVNRHGLTLHLIIHPIVAVLRDKDGRPCRRRPGRRARRDPGIVHPRRGRPRDGAREPCGACHRRRARARRRADGGERLEEDEGQAPRRHRRGRSAPAADAAGGARRVQGVPVLARQRALHVPGLPLPRSRRGRRAGRPQDRPGIEPGLPPRKSQRRTSRRASRRCRRRFARTPGTPTS